MRASVQTKLSPRGCGICGATAARELYTARGGPRNSARRFTIARCDGCGVLRTLPEMSDEEIAHLYTAEEAGGGSAAAARQSQAEKMSVLSACAPGGGRLLDVGCGAGDFLRSLSPETWDPFGIEVNQSAAAAAERIIGARRIFNGTLIESACEDDYFDVVTFWSSLERTNEPRNNLVEARRILKRGGSLIAQVLNAASYQARWFDGNWPALDAPRQRYHFTPLTLTRLLGETGFQVTRISFRSKSDDADKLRQGLKAKLQAPPAGALGRAAFLASLPFIKPVDLLMSAMRLGATLTVAARAV